MVVAKVVESEVLAYFVRTAALIGPHQPGKKGSGCPRGSRRFRAGTGERERSESAMITKPVSAMTTAQNLESGKKYQIPQ